MLRMQSDDPFEREKQMASYTKSDPHHALVEEALAEHFRAAKRGQARALVILIVVLATFAYFAVEGETISTQRGAAICGALTGALVLWLGYLLTVDRSNVPGVVALRERRHEIVWAFAELQNNVPLCVSFGLSSGEILSIDGATQLLIERVRPALRHATVGFSPEIATQFRADPAALRRELP